MSKPIVSVNPNVLGLGIGHGKEVTSHARTEFWKEGIHADTDEVLFVANEGFLGKLANVVDRSSYFDTAANQTEALFWPLGLGIWAYKSLACS